MSKNVAILNGNEIVAINLHNDDYELQQNEVLVTDVAFIGGSYVDDYFYAPQPYPSWTRNNGNWQPPTPMPTEGRWRWDEDSLSWLESEQPF